MTTPVNTAPQTQPRTSSTVTAPEGKGRLAPSLAEEINARRARIENPELLQHLRGL